MSGGDVCDCMPDQILPCSPGDLCVKVTLSTAKLFAANLE